MDCIKYNGKIENSANLPHYPNPGLKETLAKYLTWLEPLVTAEELVEARAQVQAFMDLEQFDEIKKKMDSLAEDTEDSYIYNYWVRAHLGFRDPICPHTSVPIVYDNKSIATFSQAEKAAAILASSAKVYKEYRTRGNEAYTLGNKSYSNDELLGALASINHIAENLDEMYICDGISKHSLVMYKNRMYKIDVLTENNEYIAYGDILNAVQDILDSSKEGLDVNFNLASCEPERNRAAKVLEILLQDKTNQEEYQYIKDAIMVVNLDTCKPETLLQRLFASSSDPVWSNRFHGKGTQFAVCENGNMSMVVDHTYCDGGIEVYLVTRMSEEYANLDYKKTKNTAPCRELVFNIDEHKEKLQECLARYRAKIAAFDARIVDFPALTRGSLKEKGILSADGFMHLAFQVAQKLTWKEIYNTYISVDCRKFFRGRTEVNRPITHESKAFVSALLANESKETLSALREEALNAHFRRTKEAQAGLGVNRYLYTLKEVCNDYRQALSLPEDIALFTSKQYQKMCEDRLSCTSFGHDDMVTSYFPPVVPQGLGIFYRVENASYAVITSYLENDGLLDVFSKNLKVAVEKILEI